MSNEADQAIDNTSEREGLTPLDKEWIQFVVIAIISIWVIGLMILARSWSWQDRAFPHIFGTVLLLFCILQMLKILSQKDYIRVLQPLLRYLESSKEQNETRNQIEKHLQSDRSAREQNWYAIIVSVWVIALPALIHLFGFFYAIPAYVFGFVLFFTHSIKMSIFLTLLTTSIMYVLFTEIMNVRLWDGIVLFI